MAFIVVELNPQFVQLLLQVFLIANRFSFGFHNDGWPILHLALFFHPLEYPR